MKMIVDALRSRVSPCGEILDPVPQYVPVPTLCVVVAVEDATGMGTAADAFVGVVVSVVEAPVVEGVPESVAVSWSAIEEMPQVVGSLQLEPVSAFVRAPAAPSEG